MAGVATPRRDLPLYVPLISLLAAHQALFDSNRTGRLF